jgi:spore germination protein GerM
MSRCRRTIRLRRAALVLLVASGVGACGIPADDGPRTISQEQVPDDLEDGADAADEGQTQPADLYFARFDGERDNLVVVEREVPTGGSASTPTPATVLESLLVGVLDDDAGADSIVTKIPADTALASQPELAGGVLTVDLNAAISGVQADGARLAYGQMVCTVDALDEVEGVLFTIEGEPVQPPAGDGQASSAPLTCESYAGLLEDAPSPAAAANAPPGDG